MTAKLLDYFLRLLRSLSCYLYLIQQVIVALSIAIPREFKNSAKFTL